MGIGKGKGSRRYGTHEEKWVKSRAFKDDVQFVAGLKGLIWGCGADGLEETTWVVDW